MTQNVTTVQPDQTNQASAFRRWVQEIWMQNCEEHLTYGEDPYTIKQYWSKYKWWLRREFRFQQRQT